MVRLPKRRRHCSFCSRDETVVARLIAGPAPIFICDVCVGLCERILAGEPTPGFAGWEGLSDSALLKSLKPSELALEEMRGLIQRQVEILRKRGVSWQAIGDALGISRQAAWERFS
jgi:hypothetical protein